MSDTPAAHAPEPIEDEAPDRIPRQELTPEDALALLQQGKPLMHAKVRNLKLTKLVFPKLVQFRNVLLVKPEFTGCDFQKGLEATGCTVHKPFVGDCTLGGAFKLSGSEVTTPMFRQLVGTQLNFAGTRFRGAVKLHGCKLSGGINFWDARFAGWLDVAECEFAGRADFRNLHAEEGVNLTKNVFLGEALFRGSYVAKKFDLSGSRFEGLLDLSKAKLQDYAYLEDIVLGPQGSFAFQNMLAERLQVKQAQLVGRLASENAGDHATAAKEYAGLKASYQKLHRFDDEDWAFYQFKVAHRKARPFSWTNPWQVFQRFGEWLLFDRGCGYGTQPLRAVFAGLTIVVVFGLFYMAGHDKFVIEKWPFPELGKDHWANLLVFGLTTSTSVFTSGLGGDRLSKAEGWVLAPLAIEALLGTLLFGLFIVAFSRKVIR